jgi:hypothetical protein
LEYHTSYTVKLNTKPKHSSLHDWCLQEFDKNDDQVGDDLIPWGWTLYFNVTNIRHTYALAHDDTDLADFDEETMEPKTGGSGMDFQCSESILAKLIPAEGRNYNTSYSMFGTDRKIENFSIDIEKSDIDSCQIWGSVSYTFELDFRDETTEDTICVQLRLTPDKFDELVQMINRGGTDEASLMLSGVRGFYSEWSPEISTNFIKVLSSVGDEQKVEIAEDAGIDPPQLSTVQEFRLSLNNNHRLTTDNQTDTIDYEWAEKKIDREVQSVSKEYGSEDDEDALSSTVNQERVKALQRTAKYDILKQMFRDASSHVANNNLGPHALDDLSGEIRSFFYDLEYSFQKDSWSDYEEDPQALTEFYQRSWELWQHPRISFKEIKKGNVLYFDQDSLREAVDNYLKLPIRNQRIDRMLVGALVAAELIAYADEMLNVPKFLRDLSTSPFVKSHPLWRFIKGQVASFVMVAAIPIGVLVGAVKFFDFGGEWPFFVGLGFAGLWALFFLIGLFALPGLWASETRHKRKSSELLENMAFVYDNVGTGRIISAHHIRERLDKTADQGVVWPSEVFPLLDDIIDRGGMM